MNEEWIDGLLLVDKPTGPTSHDVVDVVRRRLRRKRVGHAGTLDPFASGLLVVATGRATRLLRFIAGEPKRYTGILRLGVRTDSDDRTGEPTHTHDGPLPALPAVMQAAAGLVGRYPQTLRRSRRAKSTASGCTDWLDGDRPSRRRPAWSMSKRSI